MSHKLYYSIIALCLVWANILLLETRFNIVGMGFGVAAAIFIVKALRTKL